MCTKKEASARGNNMLYLLGPTKCFSQQEMKIYKLSGLCRVREFDKGVNITVVEDSQREESSHSNCDNADAQKDGRRSKSLFRPWKSFPKPWFRQNYAQWKASMDMNFRLRKIKKHKVICIQPLDDFPSFVDEFTFGDCHSFFEFLRLTCEVFFFGFEVRLLPPVDMGKAGWNVTSRIHSETNQRQYLVKDIQANLHKLIPKDGYCVVGISWTDLYPAEHLNFVLGEASAGPRSGVISFGRFEPKKFRGGLEPPLPMDCINSDVLWRMIKVITHETCHILGLAHCNFFDCAMNESTAVDEAMKQPFFLCPVCLRKLHKTAKFDTELRYRKLLAFLQCVYDQYQHMYIGQSIEWLEQVLLYLRHDASTQVVHEGS